MGDETAQVEEKGNVIFSGMRVYMGMQVGEPTPKRAPTTGRWDYYGPCVNKSARVAHAANGGQVLITNDILNAIKKETADRNDFVEGEHYVKKDMGKHSLKGIAQPVHMYEVLPCKLKSRSA